MTPEEILETAHIHFESATFRVHVKDSKVVNTEAMEEDKPDFVLFVSKSNDYTQSKTSILVEVVGDYDLKVMAEWLRSHNL